MYENQFKSIYEIADAVISKIGERNNPFDKITLVFHNAKIAQWFKAYFLKKEKSVLMNVECKTLSSFINETINSDRFTHILTVREYREYVIKALLSLNTLHAKHTQYYKNGDDVNGIHLYEFANKLATVFFNMEFDDEEIDVDWQKTIYETANAFAAQNPQNQCFTPKQVCLKNKDCLNLTDGEVLVFNNSYISNLYKAVLSDISKRGVNVSIFSLAQNDEMESDCQVSLYAAPSKKREIEQLHSDICKKIESDKDALVSDFVVFAPNINEYANVIRSVFQKNTPGFPEVPFRIVDESIGKYDMATALDLLHKIACKGFFTRRDLFHFLKNPMVMFVKSIDEDDVQTFLEAVKTTNTYRNGGGKEDWDYLKKRLLTSLMTDELVSLGDGDYLTYSSIGLDTDRIDSFVEIIENLSKWCQLFACADISNKKLNNHDLVEISKKLDDLFSFENSFGEEKNYLYAEVKNAVSRMKEIFQSFEIPATTFLLLLKSASSIYVSSPSDIFSSGVTFISFDIDNVVPAQNIYVLGMSSNSFPRIEKKSEIDFSKNHKYTYELDKAAFRNLMVSSRNITTSFVYCDLQKGEEFFPSTVIPNSLRDEYNRNKDVYRITIDEKRPLDDLFTYSELLKLKRIANIGSNNCLPNEPSPRNNNGSEKITTSQIKKYLENTFIYKYSKLFGKIDEDDVEDTEEFECLDVKKGLKEYNIIKKIILTAFTLNEIGKPSDWNAIKKNLSLNNNLPSNLEEFYYNSFYDKYAKVVIDELDTGYKRIDSFTLPIENCILEMDSCCFVKEAGLTLFFLEPKKHDKDSDSEKQLKDCLTSYVCAMAYVARQNDDKDYTISLNFDAAKFQLNSTTAKDIINKIFKQMLDLESVKYMDIDFIVRKIKKNSIPSTLDELVIGINSDNNLQHNSWKYFDDKQRVDPHTDFGYDSNKADIGQDILDEFSKIKDLLLYF